MPQSVCPSPTLEGGAEGSDRYDESGYVVKGGLAMGVDRVTDGDVVEGVETSSKSVIGTSSSSVEVEEKLGGGTEFDCVEVEVGGEGEVAAAAEMGGTGTATGFLRT